jgi:hypothetical protein
MWSEQRCVNKYNIKLIKSSYPLDILKRLTSFYVKKICSIDRQENQIKNWVKMISILFVCFVKNRNQIKAEICFSVPNWDRQTDRQTNELKSWKLF